MLPWIGTVENSQGISMAAPFPKLLEEEALVVNVSVKMAVAEMRKDQKVNVKLRWHHLFYSCFPLRHLSSAGGAKGGRNASGAIPEPPAEGGGSCDVGCGGGVGDSSSSSEGECQAP
jgi:hypothetical protein